MLASELVGQYAQMTKHLNEDERQLAMVLLAVMLHLVRMDGNRLGVDMTEKQIEAIKG
jgi:hypothetical protein